MRITGIALPALLAASITLALFLTLGAGQQTEASRINAGEKSRSVSTLQAITPMGDVDCNGSVNAIDALKVLRYTINLSVAQAPGCPPIGTDGPPLQGDIDCNEIVDLVDSLKIFRYVAALSVIQTEPCPDIDT